MQSSLFSYTSSVSNGIDLLTGVEDIVTVTEPVSGFKTTSVTTGNVKTTKYIIFKSTPPKINDLLDNSVITEVKDIIKAYIVKCNTAL